jgi:protein NrfC
MTADKSRVIPASQGYILVDPKKCQGCLTCMLACSLVHDGKESLSLSRIQVIQNPFERFPADLTVAQCRQCLSPACVDACPTGALDVDTNKGNIRTVNVERCNGCRECIQACPHKPHRIVWNFEEDQAITCDLCANTPFWNKKGGPGGVQACVVSCPIGALKFTKETPAQDGDTGYVVNLRGKSWKAMGYPTD